MKKKILYFAPIVLTASLLFSCGYPESSSEPIENTSETTSEVIESSEEITTSEEIITSEEIVSSEGIISSEPVVSSEEITSEEVLDPLAAPTLVLNESKNGLTWNAIEGAIGYEVKVNDADPVAMNGYAFDNTIGNYAVSVRALAEDSRLNSNYSDPYNYETKATALESIAFEEGVITWTGLAGTGIEYKIGDGDYAVIEGESLTVAENGVYTLRPIAGYDETNLIWYVDGEGVEKSYNAAPAVHEEYVIEDGSASSNAMLQEEYTIEKYGESGWAESAANLVLSEENVGISDGKCIQLNYWKHSAWFRYNKSIAIDKAYDTFSFYTKGMDGASNLSLVFQLNHSYEPVEGFDLIGSYMTYRLTGITNQWVKHEVSMNDEAWSFNWGGTDYTLAQIQGFFAEANYELRSAAELLPLFDEFSIRVYCAADANWSSTKMWLDDIKVTNDSKETSHEVIIPKAGILSEYAISGAGAYGRIKTISDTEATAIIKANGQTVTLPIAMNMGETDVTLTSDAQGMDVVLTLRSEDGGWNWDYVEASGALAALFDGAKMSAIKTADDFSSYESTGTPYYQGQTDYTKATGLHAAYYSDYYSGSGSSPVGGNGWTLMGGTDGHQLRLNTSAGYDDSKCAEVKNNSACDMRHMTRALALNAITGTTDYPAPAMASGYKYLSFMAKGTTAEVALTFYAYYRDNLTASTQASDRHGTSIGNNPANFSIPANSDWTQYTIEIDPYKVYYGFSFVALKNHGTNVYEQIDNITFHNEVSPFSAIQ